MKLKTILECLIQIMDHNNLSSRNLMMELKIFQLRIECMHLRNSTHFSHYKCGLI